jgi:hypothetical protein
MPVMGELLPFLIVYLGTYFSFHLLIQFYVFSLFPGLNLLIGMDVLPLQCVQI